MFHPQPGYKIRHLKIGARLVELLCCDSEIVFHLLHKEKFNIFEQIFNLYYQKYMALSIKLLFIKAMYSCLDSKIAIDYFLNEGLESGYKKLIYAIKSNPLTRVKFALKSLLQKVTLYESLQLIQDIVGILFQNDQNENEDRSSDLQLLRINLEEVLKSCTWNEISFTQPKRFLPVASKFEIFKDTASAKSVAFTFYSYFNSTSFLQSLLVLISNEHILPESIQEICVNLVESLVNKTSGLDLLVNNLDLTNALIKCLMDLPAVETDKGDLAASQQILANPRKQKLGIEIAFKVSGH